MYVRVCVQEAESLKPLLHSSVISPWHGENSPRGVSGWQVKCNELDEGALEGQKIEMLGRSSVQSPRMLEDPVW